MEACPSATAVTAVVGGDTGHIAVTAAAVIASAVVAAAAVVSHTAAEEQYDQDNPQAVVIVVPHSCHLTLKALCYHMR